MRRPPWDRLRRIAGTAPPPPPILREATAMVVTQMRFSASSMSARIQPPLCSNRPCRDAMVAVLESELQRVSEENQRLGEMLTEAAQPECAGSEEPDDGHADGERVRDQHGAEEQEHRRGHGQPHHGARQRQPRQHQQQPAQREQRRHRQRLRRRRPFSCSMPI
ncbi:hypothetical protein ZWY2020_029734 [Hordeum vulgare]|nr:hypothetical protein ZWY2020_029734 [Hordeum vulgare]